MSAGEVAAPLIDFDEVLGIIRSRPDAYLIAIDGLPVSGKSTLATRCEVELGLECIYLDDFVRPEAEWRGRIRPSFPFGYIRYDEFLGAVQTLTRGDVCRYRPYDWSAGQLRDDYREVRPDNPVVVEGVSSLHPAIAPLYQLRFWVESDDATTLQASLRRGVGGWEHEWRELFMPSVQLYLETNPRQRAEYLAAGRGSRRQLQASSSASTSGTNPGRSSEMRPGSPKRFAASA